MGGGKIGVQGRSPGEGLEDEVSQKLKNFTIIVGEFLCIFLSHR